MYSLVLAAMLTAGTADAPAWGCHGCHGCWGCHGCCGGCYGCYGCCGGCYGCWGCCGGCSGCYGCWGCSGCYGCWGCDGCYGCWGGWSSCYGCWGGWSDCYGCWGSCYGCYGCSGCYGCWGCYGGYAYAASPAPLYVASAPAAVPAAAQATADKATVVVQLPADARLWVDGRLADLTSSTRSFVTPALQKDRDYTYTIKAEVTRDGRAVAQSQRVLVRAGQVTRLDFGDLTTTARVTPAAGGAPAHLTVRLPENARLFVDGVAYPGKSATPSFDTPRLDAGRTYAYTLKVEVPGDGPARSETRRVELQAGQRIDVDFRDVSTVASR